jgi:hypothetical protein
VVFDEEAIDKWLEELICAIHEATVASAPRRRSRATKGPLFPLVFSMKYA